MGGRYILSEYRFHVSVFQLWNLWICRWMCVVTTLRSVWESVFCMSCKGLSVLFQELWVCSVLLTSMSATILVSMRLLEARRPISYWEETKVADGRARALINAIIVATLSSPSSGNAKASMASFQRDDNVHRGGSILPLTDYVVMVNTDGFFFFFLLRL